MTSKQGEIQNLGYVPALDGLRALAVILVMLVHAHFKYGTNGNLGVSVFFALSGFLITTLLLEEFNKNGTISFKGFYIRRTMRLFPPLYLLLAFIVVYAMFFCNPSDQKIIFQDIISSGLYIYNIAWYWGWSTKEFLLGHTWSLGVEEQFYLLWPMLLFLCIKKRILTLLGILLLIFIPCFIFIRISDHMPYLLGSIISESIFVGCAAALLRWVGWLKNISGFLAFLLLMFILVIGMMPIKLPHQLMVFNLVGILSALIILHLIQNRQSSASKLLSNKFMVFIGKISYSLYLWHLPVFRVFYYHSTLNPVLSFIGKFVVAFGLAALSWFTIEKKTTAYGRKLSKRFTGQL